MKLRINKKKIALSILALPILFLLAFAIGEGLSPEFGISGFILHLTQTIPLMILFWVCIKWPKIGGKILITLSIISAGIILFVGKGSVGIRFVPIIILCGLPFTSGLLLLKS